jgi:hypothetical protein
MEQLRLRAVERVHQSSGVAPHIASEPALIKTRLSGRRASPRKTLCLSVAALAFLCLQLMFGQTAAGPVRLYPVDDSARDPAFHSYVRKLQAAVDKRDTVALRKLVDAKDVVVGADKQDKGWAKFTRRWKPDDRENSPLWPALSTLLSLGFVQEHPRLFLSPYLVWRFPRDLPVRDPLVVIRDNVPLRKEPSPRAEVVGYLSFEIVERLRPPQQLDDLIRWFYVRTFSGKSGYLDVKDAMTPAMPRAQFGMRDGRWLLIAFEGPEE